jgi:hypothetical protein
MPALAPARDEQDPHAPVHDRHPPVVSLDEARFPVSLTFLAENAWSIHEAIGAEHVAHGHLHYSRGRFAIMTAAGEQTYGPSWQAALTSHLHTR